MNSVNVAAVDLGASSGRVIIGTAGPDLLRLTEVARFDNDPVRIADGLHWNILELYRQVLGGLREAIATDPGIASIGVDSWAVDYALLRGDRMVGTPFHYRDQRTAAGVATTHAIVAPQELYARNGLQLMPFNTLYQLRADQLAGALSDTDRALLIPDLLTFWLTGHAHTERTNASTTGLLDVRTSEWDRALIAKLGLPDRLLADLVDPGTTIGLLGDQVRTDLGATRGLRVIAVASHDTASAVAAVPMTGPGAAYISCGTWSLVGQELASPVLTEASRAANFTNEGGVDRRVRYLRNVMGLWLLSESMRTWQRESGEVAPLPDLLAAAAAISAGRVPTFDVDDPAFLPPGDMPARIAAHLVAHGQQPPESRAEMVRSIVESLALAYARTLRQASELSGQPIDRVHIIGGGSQNALLCQRTADRSGLPVHAGPVEATALGNVLVQARALGVLRGGLEDLRALVARTHPTTTYQPTPGAEA